MRDLGDFGDADTQQPTSSGGFGRTATIALIGGILAITLFGLTPLFLLFPSLHTPGMFRLMSIMPIVLPFVIMAIIGLIVWAIVSDSTSAAAQSGLQEDPLHILEQRYTNGHITLDEYEHRLEQLFELDGDFDIDPRIEQLAIRFARGDFDQAEFEQRLDRLHAQDPQLEPTDAYVFLSEAFGATDPVSIEQPTVFASGEMPTAIERLRRRYADGELTDEAYQRKLAILQDSATD